MLPNRDRGCGDDAVGAALSAGGQTLPDSLFGRSTARGAAVVPDNGAEGSGISVGSALRILRRRRAAFLLSLLLVPGLAWVALKQAVPRYTATATVLYDPSAYAARELQSILRADPTTEPVMSSQAEIVRGLPIATRVAAQFSLYDSPEFNPALRPPSRVAGWIRGAEDRGVAAVGWLSREQAQRIDAAWPRQDRDAAGADAKHEVELAVRDATGAATAKASRVLEITFVSKNRHLAADAANWVAQLYIDDQLESKVQAVHRATRWLEERLTELRREVRTGEDRIAAFRAKQGLVRGVQAGLDTEQVSRLSADLMQARNDLAQSAARLDAARGRSGAASQAAIAPSVGPLRLHQDQLSAQLQSLLARLGPNHPEAIAARNQFTDAQRSVGAEVARVIAASEAELRVARDRVAVLEQALTGVQATLERNEQAQVPLNAIERDVEASRTLLAAVLERIQQTVQQTAIETPDARLISLALPPTVPSFPRTVPLLAAAGAFGLLFGLFLVYLLEVSDSTFRSGDDVRARLGLACFALIPEVGRRQLGGARIDEYAAHKPLSPFAEQLRALRAALWLGQHRPRVIAITAARPAEGKTTVALSLGRIAAMAGERVAVVDCDIRQPALGRLLQADGNLGLVDCLLGHARVSDIVRRDPLTRLDYVPAGAAEANSLGLLMSDAMVGVLESLRAEYDLVLLDAPPACAMADARVVARLADATLLCLRWRSTPCNVVRNSLELLAEAQAHSVGVVLTRVDAAVHLRSGYADAEVYHPRYGGYFRA